MQHTFSIPLLDDNDDVKEIFWTWKKYKTIDVWPLDLLCKRSDKRHIFAKSSLLGSAIVECAMFPEPCAI